MIYTTTNQFFHNRASDIVMTFKSRPNFISNGNWLLDLNTIPKKASNKLTDYMSKQPNHRVRFASDDCINSLDRYNSMYRMHELTNLNVDIVTYDTKFRVKQFHNEKIGTVLIQTKFVNWMSKNIGNLQFETNAKNSPIIIYKKCKKKKTFIGFIMPVRS